MEGVPDQIDFKNNDNQSDFSNQNQFHTLLMKSTCNDVFKNSDSFFQK